MADNIFKEVAEKSDIVKVVSYFLGAQQVKRKGKVYYSLCPFHNDHHPSMRIDPERNIYKCFTCGEGGNAIAFAEKYAHLTPIEALKKVAEICSIPLNLKEFSQSKVKTLKAEYPSEIKALSKLSEFYELVLKTSDGADAREYLKSRGIDENITQHFHIGFAPNNNKQSIEMLRSNGFEIATLEKAGIIGNSFNLVDRYENRLMFPITDNYGNVVGFSGRKIKPEQSGGKYINYPETPLFVKNRIMYHFDKAKETLNKDKFIYLVEGFMDVIAFVRAGINSVAGLMGTALTDEHLQTLANLKVQVRLALDFDEAGQLGEERVIESLLKYHIPFKIVRPYKKAKDADEILTRFGKKELLSVYSKLLDPVLFLLARHLHGKQLLNDSDEIEKYLSSAKSAFKSLSSIEQSKDLKTISQVTLLDEEVILKVLNGKDVTQNKPTNNSDYKPRKYLSNEEKKPFLNFVVGGKYKNINNFAEYLNELGNIETYGLPVKMIKLEAQILMVIMENRKAFDDYFLRHITLFYQPFYQLAAMIDEFYSANPEATCLENEDIDNLLMSINMNNDHNVVEDSDDAFDVSDFSKFLNLSPAQKDLIYKLLELRKQNVNLYDPIAFKDALETEKIFIEYVDFQRKVTADGTIDNPEVKLRLSQYKNQLKLDIF